MREVDFETVFALDVVQLHDVEGRVDDDRIQRVARLPRVLLGLKVAASTARQFKRAREAAYRMQCYLIRFCLRVNQRFRIETEAIIPLLVAFHRYPDSSVRSLL